MKQEIHLAIKRWKKNPPSIKVLLTSLLGAIIFLLIFPLLIEEKVVPEPTFPRNWKKIELTVSAILQIKPGDQVCVHHSNGEIIISQAIIVSIKSQEPDHWKVEVAIAPLNPLQWRQLSSMSLDPLYLTPLMPKQVVKNTIKGINYEMVY